MQEVSQKVEAPVAQCWALVHSVVNEFAMCQQSARLHFKGLGWLCSQKDTHLKFKCEGSQVRSSELRSNSLQSS